MGGTIISKSVPIRDWGNLKMTGQFQIRVRPVQYKGWKLLLIVRGIQCFLDFIDRRSVRVSDRLTTPCLESKTKNGLIFYLSSIQFRHITSGQIFDT